MIFVWSEGFSFLCDLSFMHKCSACYKQFNKKEHLVEHMKVSYHSVHQPKCGICKKHCRSFESLREHSKGWLAKDSCSKIFHELGCGLCMKVFESSIFLSEHKWTCHLIPPTRLGTISLPSMELKTSIPDISNGDIVPKIHEAIAMDCEMVGGGSDGTLNLCGRVCLIDENEDILFHAYVQPQMPVTDYRSDLTGLSEEHLRDAMPLKEVQEKILEILYNGESIGMARVDGGKAKLLVGHSLEHDLDCLNMSYPDHLIRDTAKYHPLMKTNLVSHSLKYLTKMYLGYDIQMGIHDPFEDCVSVMRLYKRMREQDHLKDFIGACHATEFQTNEFECCKMKDLEKLTPDELFEMSRSKYRCWCLDMVHKVPPQLCRVKRLKACEY
ncbi:RNA exonuclease 4 isoform X3 [Spinacia oleracea]|uniref:RNA exonuclease 4 n=1 Tax=Spinacia oleracea TaxID=3562 RepID=A0ABM3RV29_SPIOL|nr:RNA exonuclease 4 isoform X3 [Spinacia oleracea]